MKSLLTQGWIGPVAHLAVAAVHASETALLTHPDSGRWPGWRQTDLAEARFPAGVRTLEDGVFAASEDEALRLDKDFDEVSPGRHAGATNGLEGIRRRGGPGQ